VREVWWADLLSGRRRASCGWETVQARQPLIDESHGGPGGSAVRAGRLRHEQVISGLGSRR
jgi:hypothetical protein